MTRLLDLCSLIRSKNAGPFWLTFDVVAQNQEAYRRIIASNALNAELEDVPTLVELRRWRSPT
jgi:hypothetical protein